MKAFLLLLFCFSVLAVFPTSYTKTPFPGEPYTKEFFKYYKNGNLNYKITVFYIGDGSEQKTLTESYRKNGTKRDFTVMNHGDRVQYIKYDKIGLMKFERNYYYSNGTIESIETRRPNGEIRIWTSPAPDAHYVYLKPVVSPS